MNSRVDFIRFSDMKYLMLLFSVLVSFQVEAQSILSVHTEWDDSYREWKIIAMEDDSTEIEGELDITWELNDDFTSYDFRIGEYYGTIKQVFANDPKNWELRMGGEVVSIRQVWSNDLREWKIRYRKKALRIATRYGNTFEEWSSRNYGNFFVYTEWSGDTRDWIVEDYLARDIPFSMKIAAVFAVIHASTPKI